MNRGDLLNPRNKNFWLLLGAALLGVALMLLGGTGSGEQAAEKDRAPSGSQVSDRYGENAAYPAANTMMTAEERELAAELQRMLGQIDGAGQVEVTVRLATSTHNDYAINTDTGLKTTEEQDQNGGTRRITENTDSSIVVITGGSQGPEEPVVKREVAPEVAGVLVVAEGAREPMVKADLFRAVQVALGVQPHKIIVMNMKRGVSNDPGY